MAWRGGGTGGGEPLPSPHPPGRGSNVADEEQPAAVEAAAEEGDVHRQPHGPRGGAPGAGRRGGGAPSALFRDTRHPPSHPGSEVRAGNTGRNMGPKTGVNPRTPPYSNALSGKHPSSSGSVEEETSEGGHSPCPRCFLCFAVPGLRLPGGLMAHPPPPPALSRGGPAGRGRRPINGKGGHA